MKVNSTSERISTWPKTTSAKTTSATDRSRIGRSRVSSLRAFRSVHFFSLSFPLFWIAMMCSHLLSFTESFQSPEVCFNSSLRCCMFDLQHRLVVPPANKRRSTDLDVFSAILAHLTFFANWFSRMSWIIKFFRVETDTNTLTWVFQQSRLQIFHDEGMTN